MNLLDFKALRCTDMELLQEYTSPWNLTCSEFTFSNLYMWDLDDRIKLCERDGVLYILLRYNNDAPFMLPPLQKRIGDDYGKALKTAADFFGQIGEKIDIRGISGSLKSLFTECGIALIEDRNNYDYIYSASDLISLAGKKYHAKRNHVHQFTSSYDYQYITVDETMLNECIDVYERWLKTKDEHTFGVKEEMKAITRLIPRMKTFGVVGGGICVGGRLEAFSLGQLIDHETALVHIEKANKEMIGLYAFINQQFLAHEFPNVKYVNREEDMGIEGLRKAKLSYHPIGFVEKYRCELE